MYRYSIYNTCICNRLKQLGLLSNKESEKMAMQARQQQQEVEVEEETFGPMPLNRLEVNTSAV